jgi:ketosteroid isomerase-like protein
MAGHAYDILREFWRVQDARDYLAVVEMFADDAVLEDPIYGVYRGKDAIRGFMAKMNAEMGGQGITFDLLELQGGDDSAWAKWLAKTPRGERHGVGIYKVSAGKITYYRDYMDPAKA